MTPGSGLAHESSFLFFRAAQEGTLLLSSRDTNELLSGPWMQSATVNLEVKFMPKYSLLLCLREAVLIYCTGEPSFH